MKKARCAVIGAGWWACSAHLPALRDNPDAEIVAVQTLDEAKLKQIARDFGAAHALVRWEDVLAIKDLDCVIIASPPNVHFAQAKAALERGLHVLVEKPVTIHASQAVELDALAKSKRLHFVSGYPWHYTRHAAEAQKLVRSGELGAIKMVSMLMVDECLGLYQAKPWSEIFPDDFNPECPSKPYTEPGRQTYADPSIAGGGQIYTQVSHMGGFLAFLTGAEPTEIFARFDNADTKVDVYNVVNLKLDNGTLASITSTGASGKTRRECPVRIYGTEGVLSIELFDGKMSFQKMNGQTREYPALSEAEIYPMGDPSKNLIDLTLGRGTNVSSGSIGATAIKIVEGATRSAQQHVNATVPWW